MHLTYSFAIVPRTCESCSAKSDNAPLRRWEESYLRDVPLDETQAGAADNNEHRHEALVDAELLLRVSGCLTDLVCELR
jgi:hypothetical protein